ncbi:MAG: YbjN domain-containing protein [Zoogloeaceae bacterium]|nr:YbjN domain-containing protein [Zoogloeaceae bacterium]
MRRSILGVLCAFFFMGGMEAAQSEENASLSYAVPDLVLQIAKGFGDVKLGQDKRGWPLIVGRSEGFNYYIFFYGCEEDLEKCKAIAFRGFWKKPEVANLLEILNAYNAKLRFGKAYLYENGDLVLDLEVEMQYGMSRENLEENFRNWIGAVRGFKRDVAAKLSDS